MIKNIYSKLLKKDKDSILRKINNYHTKTFDLSKINQELIFNDKDVCLSIIENNLFNLIFDIDYYINSRDTHLYIKIDNEWEEIWELSEFKDAIKTIKAKLQENE
jgi:hypothetical protein